MFACTPRGKPTKAVCSFRRPQRFKLNGKWEIIADSTIDEQSAEDFFLRINQIASRCTENQKSLQPNRAAAENNQRRFSGNPKPFPPASHFNKTEFMNCNWCLLIATTETWYLHKLYKHKLFLFSGFPTLNQRKSFLLGLGYIADITS